MPRNGYAFLTSKGFDAVNAEQAERAKKEKQRAEIEAAKLVELQAEREHARQIEQHLASDRMEGGKDNRGTEKMGWMYGGSGLSAETSEEYLLGKQFKLVGDAMNAHNPLGEKRDGDMHLGLQPLGTAEKRTRAAVNAISSKLIEDPLMAIMQKEQNAKLSIISNPVAMAKLRKMHDATIVTNLRDHKRSLSPKRGNRYCYRERSRSPLKNARKPLSSEKEFRVNRSRQIDRNLSGVGSTPLNSTNEQGWPCIMSKQPSRKLLTAEEKKSRLEAMQLDAAKNDAARRAAVLKSTKNDEVTNRHPSELFVANLQRSVMESSTVEEQLSRTRHYHQK